MKISILRTPPAAAPVEPSNAPVVARVIHFVTPAGTIAGVTVEPFGEASNEDVAAAAYEAGKRWPPFDDMAPRNSCFALLKQITALIVSARAMLDEYENDEGWGVSDRAFFREGYRAALTRLRNTDAACLLRERIGDTAPQVQSMMQLLEKVQPRPGEQIRFLK